MPLPRFDYVAAESLEAACHLLAEHGDRARVMAGGTDLLIHLRRRTLAPALVIGLGGVRELDYVRWDAASGLAIGALARLRDVAAHPEVRRRYPALAQAAAATATVQIRNLGTVAGNVCNASPAADTATPLLVHDAEAVIAAPGGETRTLPLVEFFRGPGKSALGRAEVLKELRVPAPPARSASDYQRLSGRSKVDIAAVGVSAFVALDGAGALATVRLALGAVAPVPLRAAQAEQLLAGQAPTAERIAAAAAAAAREASPISDVRAAADWRRKMVEVLAGRALERAVAAAAGGAR